MHFLVLPLLDDWHLHVRQDDILPSLLLASARTASRAIIMPNTIPPITDADKAKHYETQLSQALRAAAKQAKIPVPVFRPWMTLYLTDSTTSAQMSAAKAAGVVAYKLYPQGATTNSSNGVTDLARAVPAMQAMAEHGLVLCVHGEVVDPSIDIFQREAAFLSTNLQHIIAVKGLKVVLEHLTTASAVQTLYRENGVCSEKYLFPEKEDRMGNGILDRYRDSGKDEVCGNNKNNTHGNVRLAATVTPQHLLLSRDALLSGGLRVHNYCLPVLKTERDRRALLWAMGDAPRSGLLFVGTDSAPHMRDKKESCCAPAGCFTSPHALQLYATAAEQAVMWHALVEEETRRYRQLGCVGEGSRGEGRSEQVSGGRGHGRGDDGGDDQDFSRNCEAPSLPTLHPLSHSYNTAASLSTPLPPIPNPPRGAETVVGLTESDFWIRMVRVLDAMLRVNGATFYGVAVKQRRACVGVTCDQGKALGCDNSGNNEINQEKGGARDGGSKANGDDGGGSCRNCRDLCWVKEMDVCGLPRHSTGDERSLQGLKKSAVAGEAPGSDSCSDTSESDSSCKSGCGGGRCLRLNISSALSTGNHDKNKDNADASADCGVRVCVCGGDGDNENGIREIRIGFCRNTMSGESVGCDDGDSNGANEGDAELGGCVVLVRSPWTVGGALPLRRVHAGTDVVATGQENGTRTVREGVESTSDGVGAVVGEVMPLLSGEQLPWRAVFSTQLLPQHTNDKD